jgi:hypothetical protein
MFKTKIEVRGLEIVDETEADRDKRYITIRDFMAALGATTQNASLMKQNLISHYDSDGVLIDTRWETVTVPESEQLPSPKEEA